jgi:predicted nucleotidyltransferase
MLHSTFSRKGGQARSAAKTAANREKARQYWKDVQQGKRPPPRRPKRPPAASELGGLLATFCKRHGITRLEVFGSVARGEERRGSDVDLIATFQATPGLEFFQLEEELGRLLGVPVHLLTAASVETLSNPFRKAAIEAERRVIHEG